MVDTCYYTFVQTREHATPRVNEDNLYCVGRNGQHRYNNMDHSMLTGLIAADYIKENKTDKEALWNVNTEKEYHETKEEKQESK